MRVIIEIATDNDAFSGGDLRLELARILHEYADQVEAGDSLEKTLRDYNGNTVGKVILR